MVSLDWSLWCDMLGKSRGERRWGWGLVEENRTETCAENGMAKDLQRECRAGYRGADDGDCLALWTRHPNIRICGRGLKYGVVIDVRL